jgi:hypothetical protein
MDIIDQLNKDLNSSNINDKIDAIQYIAKENKYKYLTPKLLEMLCIEKDINVLNELALCLGKLGVNNAVPILMEYIRNPDYEDIRGTFLYALLDLDCDEYFLDFVKLMCVGNFEVYNHSFSIIESIIDDVDYAQKIEAIEILENQKILELSKNQGKLSRFDRINYIVDALQLLRSLI